MLPFLERIIGHLERVQRVAAKDVVDAGVTLDYGRFEAFSIRLFELHDTPLAWFWMPRYLRSFVSELYWDLLEGSGRSWSAKERFAFIEAAIVLESGLGDESFPEPLSGPRQLLAGSMLRTVTDRIGVGYGGGQDSPAWRDVEQYCERLGLTRLSTISRSGVMLLQLNGLDRTRWLLAVEACQATSFLDPWCLDLDTVRGLSGEGRWPVGRDDEVPWDRHGESINISSMERWMEFGALRLLRRVGEVPPTVVAVTAMGRKLFDELADNEATSFLTLARALIEDDRELRLPSDSGAHGVDRATAATLRHARMVAHEVRNALLPVQHALEKIFASPIGASADLSDARKRVEEGLARLYRFVDDSLRLTPIAAEEVAPFSVMEAIEEARRQCDPPPGGGVLVEARPGSADPRCRGHRGRFVLALLNLLRNAVQVGGTEVRVEIGVDARISGRVIVSVRDDGPGISEAQQATVFQNGVSYRDGGTGHGLSFVRVVVEEEMGGSVRLLSSTAPSGACFELELPTEEQEK